MPEGIFRSGTLDMPSAPVFADPAAQSWIDSDLNCILVVVSVLLMIVNLKGFLWSFPSVRQSLFRLRICLNLEHSVSMANSRDLSALVMVLPFCLISDRYSLFSHYIHWELPDWSGPLVAFVILAAYVLVRRFLCVCLKPRRMDYDYSNALYKTIYSFFIVFCIFVMVSTGIFELSGVSDAVARTVIFAEAGVFYLLSLVRSIQFLSAFCNGFATFLYLCALEIVPVAAVAAPCIFLRL